MKTSNMVPEIYYSGSRDFSFIARLYEIAINYMKSCADMVSYNLDSENADSTLIDLLCNTLGFTVKHKYINKDLVSIASIFSHLVKWKGSEYSIMEAVKTLLNSQGIKEQFALDTSDQKVTLRLPPETKDIILLEDLFDYILPAGMLIDINYSKIYNYEDSSLFITTDEQDITILKESDNPDEVYVQIYNSDSSPIEICLSCYRNGNLVDKGYFKNISNLEIDPDICIKFSCDGKVYWFEKDGNLWVSKNTSTSDIKFDNYLISESDESITKSNYSIYKGTLYSGGNN